MGLKGSERSFLVIFGVMDVFGSRFDRTKIGQKCHFGGPKMVKNVIFGGRKKVVFTMKWVFEVLRFLEGPGQNDLKGLNLRSKK